MRSIACIAAISLASPTGPRQEIDVAWYGDVPRQGAFAYLLVTVGSPDPVAIRGTLRGVPLGFERLSQGRWAALAGVPLDARDSLSVTLRLERAKGRVEVREAKLPVVAARFPSERLSVDPAFTRPPDSALAARIQRESARAREVPRVAIRTPPLWSDSFTAPRSGRITSAFGTGRVFNGQVRSRHLGVDFDGALGEPVTAANRGVVALVGDFYYSGRVIYLNHGGGIVTAYLHLSEVLVAEGDTVSRGQLIGKVGSSGRVTGPHLHWTAKFGDASQDGTTLLTLPALATLRLDGR